MPVAVVTGASRGLGLALATELNRRGWALVVDARHRADLEAVLAGLDPGPGLSVIAGDVGDDVHRGELAEAAAALGGAALLVNNASTLGPSPLPALADLPPDRLAEILDTNVVAPLALAQALLPQLRRRGGQIVNVTSDAAVEAYPGWGGYGASKAALDQLTAVLAAECPDVRCYALDPGDMRTQMHQDAFPGEDISDRPAPETVVPALLELIGSGRPSGRYRAADLQAATAGGRA